MSKRFLLLFGLTLLWLSAAYMAFLTLSQRPLLPGTFDQQAGGVQWSVNLGEKGEASWADSSTRTFLIPVEEAQERLPLSFIEESRTVLGIIDEVDDFPVSKFYLLEEILYRRNIGDTLTVTFKNAPAIQAELGTYYSPIQLGMKGLVGLLFLTIGLVVWYFRQQQGDKYFAIAGLIVGFTIMAWWPGHHLPDGWAYVYRVLVLLLYPQAFFAFLQFSYSFPAPVLPHTTLRFRRVLLQSIGITCSLILIAFFGLKNLQMTPESVKGYHDAYNVFRWLILGVFLLSIANMIRNESYHSNPVTQRKLQWVIGGLFWGVFPFIFFWNLPMAFDIPPLLPEWTFDIFFMVTPVFIAIGILRYRLFNIEIVVSRSIVYGIVLAVLIILYLLVTGGLSILLFHEFNLTTPYFSILAALIIAMLFNPIRNRVQKFVDRKFLRIRHDRFKRMEAFLASIEKVSDTGHLLETIKFHFNEAVPVDFQLFLKKDHQGKWQRVMGEGKSEDLINWLGTYEVPEEITVNAEAVKRVEKGLFMPVISLPVPWVVLLPIGKEVVWLLSNKTAKTRFWEEDLDLARQMAHAAAIQWEKISYVQISIRESLQKEHAQKLSDWKSLLVSKVAHDLRTPLSTMLWRLSSLQKRLENNDLSSNEPIEILRRQVHRLQNFINHMLTLSKIEQGAYAPELSATNLRAQLDLVIEDLEEIIHKKDLKIDVKCPKTLKVHGNAIMLQEIFLNVLDNGTKFSRSGGHIIIKAISKDNMVEVHFTDEAGGIPKEKLKKLFEPFADPEAELPGQGFNLGLYITRNYTELQNGRVDVVSKSGEGTTVILSFPAAVTPKRKPSRSTGK